MDLSWTMVTVIYISRQPANVCKECVITADSSPTVTTLFLPEHPLLLLRSGKWSNTPTVTPLFLPEHPLVLLGSG